jgi:hypothetical protein
MLEMENILTIEDTFTFTGRRGVIVVGQGKFDNVHPGMEWMVEIRTSDGEALQRSAYREMPLLGGSNPEAIRIDLVAFYVLSTEKSEVPIGSTLRVLGPARVDSGPDHSTLS